MHFIVNQPKWFHFYLKRDIVNTFFTFFLFTLVNLFSLVSSTSLCYCIGKFNLVLYTCS